MVYVTYDQNTGEVDSIAYSKVSMIPSGKSYVSVSEETWNNAQGKVMTVENGEFVVSDPPVTVEDYEKAIEDHLNAEKTARGYTTHDPSEYMDSNVQRWVQDAIDWIAHKDAVMIYGIEIINTFIETGEGPTIAQFKSALPTITWTYQEEITNA